MSFANCKNILNLYKTMTQNVVLVNKNNRKIGVEEKIRVHQEGKLHRAFSIFIFNSKGELLIQQRAKSKYHSGGLWSNTVCSHPKPSETYYQSTHRRLQEEMGFDCKLKKIFHFIYRANLNDGLIENEFDSVFIGKYDKNPNPNLDEVMDYRWISIKKLKADIKANPNKYTIWLPIALRKIKHSLYSTKKYQKL